MMGGIAALSGDRESPGSLEAMAAALGHRGVISGWSRGARVVSVGGASADEGLGRSGPMSLALDGVILNSEALGKELVSRGAWLPSGASAATVLLQAVTASSGATPVNQLIGALYRVMGGWAVVAAIPSGLVALRDPSGLRPLWMGRRDGVWGVATESSALVAGGLDVLRGLAPGEMVLLGNSVESVRPFSRGAVRPCLRERVVGLRLDARVDDGGSPMDGYGLRHALGEVLAERHGAPADVVVALDGAAGPVGAGFAARAGIPLVPAWACGAPSWVASPSAVLEKRVVLTILGDLPATDLAGAVGGLRRAGASSVHVRRALPMRLSACPLGVDRTPWHGSPDASSSARAAELGLVARADSISALALEEVQERLGGVLAEGCGGCMGGQLAEGAGISPPTSQLALFQLG